MTGRAHAGPGSRGAEPGLREKLLVGLVAALGPAVIRLLGATWRIRFVNSTTVKTVAQAGRPGIYAFWHCFILPLAYTHRGRGIVVLSSWHRDGEISARVLGGLGFAVERGSTTRGSVRGVVKMLARAREGRDLAVTPDGPRGPAHVAQTGTAFLALKAGASIIPLAAGVDRGRRLASWDRFIVPAPFARVVVLYGDAIDVTDDDDLEHATVALSMELDRLSSEAHALAASCAGDDERGAGQGNRTEGGSGV